MAEDSGTRPLYEEVRYTIYQNFEAMKRQNAKLMVARNKYEIKWNLINFRERFANFYMEVYHDSKLKNLSQEDKEKLKQSYDNIYKLTKKDASEVTRIARFLIEEMGLMKIEYKTDKRPF